MNIVKRKSKYDYYVVDCPFCNYWSSVKEERHDPIYGLKRHIANQAKNEALVRACGDETAGSHLDYYLAHTSRNKILITEQRQFDNDLILAN